MLWKAAPGQFDTQTQIMRLQKAVEKIFPIRFKLTAIVIQVEQLGAAARVVSLHKLTIGNPKV